MAPAAPAAASGGQGSDSSATSDLQRWLRAKGGDSARIELRSANGDGAAPSSSSSSSCAVGGGGKDERLVVAKAALRRGDAVLFIPSALWCVPGRLNDRGAAGRAALAWASGTASKDVPNFPKEHVEILLLAVLLLLERRAGSGSSLAAYVASLPWTSVDHLPLTWPPATLAARLQGAAPEPGVAAKRKEMASVFASLSRFCSSKGKEAKSEFAAACHDEEALTCAFAMVHSRAMNVVSKDESGKSWTLALMPVADMFNHDSDPEADWTVEAGASPKAPAMFVVRALRDVSAGAELRFRYRGAATAQAFFATYGFVEGGVAAPAELHPAWESPPSAEAVRLSSCRSLRRLLSRLRVATATPEERSRLEPKASPSDAARLPISLRNERQAMEQLCAHLAARARRGQESEAAAEADELASAPGAAAAKALRAADAAGWVWLGRFAAAVLAALAPEKEGDLSPTRLAIIVHAATRAAARGAHAATAAASGAGAAAVAAASAASAAAVSAAAAAPLAAGAASFVDEEVMEVKDVGGAKGRGYYAKKKIDAGTLLLAEEPFIFDAADDDFSGVAAAHVLGVAPIIELRPSPSPSGDGEEVEGGGKKAAKWLRGVEGVSAVDASKAFGIAQNNGFQTCLPEAPEEEPMMLFRRLCIFNHSCLPNCGVFRDDRTGMTKVLALRPSAAGEELTIHYSDELVVLPTQLRHQFIKGRFGFECACPRCRAADPSGSMIEIFLSRYAEGLEQEAMKLQAMKPAMQCAHASLCHMQMDNGVPMGFAYRSFDDWAEALAAVDRALPHIAAFGAPTFWARHHARGLKCLALKGLGRDAAEFLTLAEHADAAWRLLPPCCDALQEIQSRLDALRERLPAALLPKLEEKAKTQHAEGLAGLAADVARLRGWLQRAETMVLAANASAAVSAPAPAAIAVAAGGVGVATAAAAANQESQPTKAAAGGGTSEEEVAEGCGGYPSGGGGGGSSGKRNKKKKGK